MYRLADYLDQSGRRIRGGQTPPPDFWTAVADCAHPGDLIILADAAHRHGLYRNTAQLHKRATTSGDPYAARRLIGNLHRLHPSDHRPARWAVIHVALDNPHGVAGLLNMLREAGAHEQVSALVARDPAAHVALDNPHGVTALLNVLRRAGAQEQAAMLADRAARAAEQAGAVNDRLPREDMFNFFKEQVSRRERFWFGRETDGRPAKPWGWEDLG
jgi:hypothetical protein